MSDSTGVPSSELHVYVRGEGRVRRQIIWIWPGRRLLVITAQSQPKTSSGRGRVRQGDNGISLKTPNLKLSLGMSPWPQLPGGF